MASYLQMTRDDIIRSVRSDEALLGCTTDADLFDGSTWRRRKLAEATHNAPAHDPEIADLLTFNQSGRGTR